MALYKDATGQLVISATLPIGGSVVSAAATNNLSDLAPWYRNLDAANVDWHPAKFYGGAAESAALGTNGYSNAQVAAYKRSATLPTDNPGNVTYDFTNASITTSLGAGWYSDIPAGSGPVYVVFAPAASQDTTIAILAADWTNPPVLLFDSGTDGESSFPSFVFIRSATQPATPTGGSYASPLPTTVGWSDGIPSDNNKPLWMSKRVFSKSGGAPQDAVWSATSKVGTPSTSSKLQFSVDGTAGWHDTPSAGDEFMRSGTSADNGATWTYAGVVRIKGEAGSSGTATRGPSHWYTSGSFWSDSIANAVVTAAGYTPMAGDQVTISGTNFAHVRKWNGSSWIDLGQVITGDLVVENSITVNKLNTNSIEVRDNFGNVLFSVNVPLDYARVSGSTRPENNATLGANSNNFTGGASANLLSNGSLTGSLDGWVNYIEAGMTINAFYKKNPGEAGAIGTYGGLVFSILGPVRDYASSIHTHPQRVPCKPGDRFELQAMVQVFRGRALLQLSYFNAAGDWIGGNTVAGGQEFTNFDNQPELGAGIDLSNNIKDWYELWGFMTVPAIAGVVACALEIRVARTQTFASTDVYVGMAYLGYASAGQTEKSNWVDGTPRGALSTVDQINASNIDVYMGDLAVKTLKIAGRAINGNLYTGAAIFQPLDPSYFREVCRVTIPAVAFGVRSAGVGIGMQAIGTANLSAMSTLVKFSFEYSTDGGSSWNTSGLTAIGNSSFTVSLNQQDYTAIGALDFLIGAPDSSMIIRFVATTVYGSTYAFIKANVIIFDAYR